MEAIPLRPVIHLEDDQGTQSKINVAASIPYSEVPHIVVQNSEVPHIVVQNLEVPHIVIQLGNISLSEPRFPSCDLLDDTTALKELCVPLQKATLRGDLDGAKDIIAKKSEILTSSIALGGRTVLHLAVGTGNVQFVKYLLGEISPDDLELRDEKKNTALCDAVIVAPVEIAKLMIEKNPKLPTMRGGADMMPAYMAALFKRSEMAWYLYDKTKESLNDNDRIGLFFTCINTGIYDLALEMLKVELSLATARDDKGKTALHHLAVTPSAFACQSSQGWPKMLESWFNFKFRKNSTQTKAIELVECLWDEVLNLGPKVAMDLIRTPSELLFDATRIGNFEFLTVLMNSYPDLVWECNSENRTIFHIAVQYRHADIFNMAHVFGSTEQIIFTYEDDDGNNILHLAAMLPPPDRLNIVSGAALQMQKELLWFQEVQKVVIPLYEKKENKEGMVPEQLFSAQHELLLKHGKKWLKDTSHSGLIVSTILTTVVFAAAFSLPGGNNTVGTPNDLNLPSFKIFVVSDGVAMVSSVVAALMFLSILTSRCAEYDFLKSLPLKLVIALTSLFVSILTTMMAFSSTVTIACRGDLKWVPYLISMIAFLPIALFVFLQFPLWFDTFSSTCWSRTMFWPPRHILY